MTEPKNKCNCFDKEPIIRYNDNEFVSFAITMFCYHVCVSQLAEVSTVEEDPVKYCKEFMKDLKDSEVSKAKKYLQITSGSEPTFTKEFVEELTLLEKVFDHIENDVIRVIENVLKNTEIVVLPVSSSVE